MRRDEFRAAIDRLEGSRQSAIDNLIVLGGSLSHAGGAGIATFLDLWKPTAQQRPWRIVQWASDVRLEYEDDTYTLPGSLNWLQRFRAFGAGGDLTLRRDGERVWWHFVGPKAVENTLDMDLTGEAQEVAESNGAFCARRLELPDGLMCSERTDLLWGQERLDDTGAGLGVWDDNRVAGGIARLTYGGLAGSRPTSGRAALRYREYRRGDVVEAVWFVGLEWWVDQSPAEKETTS